MNQNLVFCIVVEDEPLAQQVLENYIERVDKLKLLAKCESIKEAFDILISQQVDVVFLDLDLQAENGIEIISKMKGLNKNRYYIIITSAVSPRNFNAKSIFNTDNILFIDYLTKPFSYENFHFAIQKVIQRQEAGRGK